MVGNGDLLPERVAVGSRNPAKVEAASRVFRRAFPGVEVVGIAVPSGVAAQPVGMEETARGAWHRAGAACSQGGADWGVGLEGGVAFDTGGRGWVVSAAVIVHREGRSSLAWGPAFPLPPAVAARVREGLELGPVIDELARQAVSRGEEGAIGFLTRGLLNRRQLWEAALAAALPPFLHPELYGEWSGVV